MTYLVEPGQAIVEAHPNATNNAGIGNISPMEELATTNFQVLSVSAKDNVKQMALFPV